MVMEHTMSLKPGMLSIVCDLQTVQTVFIKMRTPEMAYNGSDHSRSRQCKGETNYQYGVLPVYTNIHGCLLTANKLFFFFSFDTNFCWCNLLIHG